MKKMTEEALMKMALYYIANDISIADLAKKYRFDKSVVTKYLEGMHGIKLPSKIQELVNAKMAENWAAGKATSGNKGKTKLDKKQVLKAANSYLKGEKSLEKIANELGVSRGTLYNMFNPDMVGIDVYEALRAKTGRRK